MDLDGDDVDDLDQAYDFDEAGNLQTVTGTGGTKNYIYGYEVDPYPDSNRLVRIEDGNGTPLQYFTFDPEDRSMRSFWAWVW